MPAGKCHTANTTKGTQKSELKETQADHTHLPCMLTAKNYSKPSLLCKLKRRKNHEELMVWGAHSIKS